MMISKMSTQIYTQKMRKFDKVIGDGFMNKKYNEKVIWNNMLCKEHKEINIIPLLNGHMIKLSVIFNCCVQAIHNNL